MQLLLPFAPSTGKDFTSKDVSFTSIIFLELICLLMLHIFYSSLQFVQFPWARLVADFICCLVRNYFFLVAETASSCWTVCWIYFSDAELWWSYGNMRIDEGLLYCSLLFLAKFVSSWGWMGLFGYCEWQIFLQYFQIFRSLVFLLWNMDLFLQSPLENKHIF